MEILEKEIAKRGRVLPGNVLKVGDFVNHQMEAPLLSSMADEICSHYKKYGVNKVLAVEASGRLLNIDISAFVVMFDKACYGGRQLSEEEKLSAENIYDNVNTAAKEYSKRKR